MGIQSLISIKIISMLDPVTKTKTSRAQLNNIKFLRLANKRSEGLALHSLGQLVRKTCRLLGLEVAAPAQPTSDFEYLLSLVRLTRRIQRCVRNQFAGAAVEQSVQKCGSDTFSDVLAEDRQTVFDRPAVTVHLDRRIQQTKVMRDLVE